MQRPLIPEDDLRPEEGQKPVAASEVADEFEMMAPDIKTDKTELQKIIERNRQQVEEDGEELSEMTHEHQRKEKIESTRELVEQFQKEQPNVTTTEVAGDDEADDTHHIKKHADEVVAISDPELQIQRIVELAVGKDPFYAIRLAKHLDDNYIMNEVHDRLVEEKVREQLIANGLIPEL